MEGSLICPETGRKFPVSKGIPNMLLNEDEVWILEYEFLQSTSYLLSKQFTLKHPDNQIIQQKDGLSSKINQ